MMHIYKETKTKGTTLEWLSVHHVVTKDRVTDPNSVKLVNDPRTINVYARYDDVLLVCSKPRSSLQVVIGLSKYDAQQVGIIASKTFEKDPPHMMTRAHALEIQADQVITFQMQYPDIDVAAIVGRVTTADMLRDDREYEVEVINIHIPRGPNIERLCKTAIEDMPKAISAETETKPAPIVAPIHPGDTLIEPAF